VTLSTSDKSGAGPNLVHDHVTAPGHRSIRARNLPPQLGSGANIDDVGHYRGSGG
jgi:hypothetical protein